ncbi:MAG: transposase [Proteobacteria bacterium]|nr:transposase [Pseudomonadota bacterium]
MALGGHGTAFHRRLHHPGITSIRTPFRSPRANPVAERWVGSVRHECLDPLLIPHGRHLRRVLVAWVAHVNVWRPHRSVGQGAPCAQEPPLHTEDREGVQVIARSVLGGRHHVFDPAAHHGRSGFCALQHGIGNPARQIPT